LSPPQHKTIHPQGMEVVANVIETCDKEAEQKLLLKGSHVHMDILMNLLKNLEKRGKINAKNPEQLLKTQAARGRNTVLMLSLWMTLISVLSETQRV